jgi:hypothetical protein
MIGEKLKSDIYIYSGATFVKVKLMKRRNVERTRGGRESAKKAEKKVSMDTHLHRIFIQDIDHFSPKRTVINVSPVNM